MMNFSPPAMGISPTLQPMVAQPQSIGISPMQAVRAPQAAFRQVWLPATFHACANLG